LRRAVGLILGLVLVLGVVAPGLAADFPTKEVQIIIPYAAGGATDLVFRALAASSSKYLGKAVVVVNKPGGGGTIGFTEAMQARPDGYTLVSAITPLTILPHQVTTAFTYQNFEIVSQCSGYYYSYNTWPPGWSSSPNPYGWTCGANSYGLGRSPYIEYYFNVDPPGQGVNDPQYKRPGGTEGFAAGRRMGQDPQLDKDGNVWVTDRGYPTRIVKLDPRTGVSKDYLMPEPKASLHDLNIDRYGVVWVPENEGVPETNPKLWQFDPKTEKWTQSFPFDPQKVIPDGTLKHPHSIDFDSRGNIYVSYILGGGLSVLGGDHLDFGHGPGRLALHAVTLYVGRGLGGGIGHCHLSHLL